MKNEVMAKNLLVLRRVWNYNKVEMSAKLEINYSQYMTYESGRRTVNRSVEEMLAKMTGLLIEDLRHVELRFTDIPESPILPKRAPLGRRTEGVNRV